MRKNCETCKHDRLKTPICDECYNTSDAPTKWEPGTHYKPDTNADRIREMTDEELARFLADKIVNENTLSWLRLYDKANIHSATEIEAIRYQWCGYWMQWLKQPAEE